MTKRKYRNSLPWIEVGLRSCIVNIRDIVQSATLLLDSNLHAPALSLSILALEEIGKFLCLEGLLFSKSDDYKAKAFEASMRSHSIKLDALAFAPMLLGHLASLDRRYEEQAFKEAIVITITDLKSRGNAVLSILPSRSFGELDKLKQQGFYVEVKDGNLWAPRDHVDRKSAEVVHALAWRFQSTLDFLLAGSSIDNHMAFGRKIRKVFRDSDHESIEKLGDEIRKTIFDRPPA